MFYIAIIQTIDTGNALETSKALFDYPTLDAALAKFHTELAYRGANRVKTVCVIMDEYGNTVKRDYWQLNATE